MREKGQTQFEQASQQTIEQDLQAFFTRKEHEIYTKIQEAGCLECARASLSQLLKSSELFANRSSDQTETVLEMLVQGLTQRVADTDSLTLTHDEHKQRIVIKDPMKELQAQALFNSVGEANTPEKLMQLHHNLVQKSVYQALLVDAPTFAGMAVEQQQAHLLTVLMQNPESQNLSN